MRIIGARRSRSDHRVLSYNRALELTGCESIEATLRARRLLWTGALTRMDDGRLPKRVMFGTIKDGPRKDGAGKRKEWWHAWKVTSSVFQDPTKLETRSPRCPELDRNSHRGRAEVYDRVDEGGRREVQIPPEENRQIARESTNVTE